MYSPELDDIVREINIPETNIQLIHASYNGGQVKVGFRRVISKANGDVVFSAIGRMTKEEFVQVRKVLASDAVMP